MNTQPDFEELLRLLEQNEVRYMIVGGYAVAFHGHPRFTKDIDIFFISTDENIVKVRRALRAFGFSDSEIPESLFKEPGNVIKIGVSPVQIDLINKIDGVRFEEAETKVVRGKYGSIEVNFIGRDDLLYNKRASGRPQDRADADILENE
ncbi:MAG: nucleotidyltransferase [bacterium]|nr:nucleotidyltransferase [bacterium]